MAIYIKQNNQLKKVGLGTMYEKDLLDPIQYRAKFRDTNWPFIPLPNEIHSQETTDCIYFLFGKDNVNEWCIPFVNVTGSNLTVNIKKYNNTTLISEDTTKTITSGTTLNVEYNSTDSDWNSWNYVLMKVTGTITNYNMNVTPKQDGTDITPSNMLLEVSGYCSDYTISNISAKKYYNLIYFGIGGSCSNISLASMFSNCYSLQAVHTLNAPRIVAINSMFNGAYSLQAMPQIDTSRVTNMGNAFQNCFSLRTIPMLDTSSVVDMSNMFVGCYSLQDIGNISLTSSVGLNSSNCLTYKTMMTIINNLATVTTSKTLTVPTYLKPLLSPSDIAVATNKGWVVA